MVSTIKPVDIIFIIEDVNTILNIASYYAMTINWCLKLNCTFKIRSYYYFVLGQNDVSHFSFKTKSNLLTVNWHCMIILKMWSSRNPDPSPSMTQFTQYYFPLIVWCIQCIHLHFLSLNLICCFPIKQNILYPKTEPLHTVLTALENSEYKS